MKEMKLGVMMNQTLEVLQKRASVRSYLNQEIKPDDIIQINEAIYRSPTAGNMQDFSVIIVSDGKLKKQLANLCDNQLFIEKAPLIYIFLADFSRYDSYFKLSNVDNHRFVAPHLGSMMNAIIDATIAAQTASVAANSLEIGTCYIGDIVEHYEEVRELLNLNDNIIPVAMLTMGYYQTQIKLSAKIDKKYIFHQNKYQKATDSEIEEMFSNKKIPKRYQNDYQNYGQFFYDHKVGADFSQEMDRSVRLYISNFDHNRNKNN